jgi:hypothetical protein
MIKKTLTLFSALLLCSTGIKAQSCATAVDLTAYTNGSPLSQSTNEEWYRFNALDTDIFLDVLETDTTFHWVDSVFVYGNTCGSLSLLGSYGRPVGGDSIGMFEVRIQGLAISSTCFIRIKLKTALTSPVNYALNLTNATAASCDYVINGDFENIGPGPCPPINLGPLICLSGVPLIPSWQTGGNGGAGGAPGPGFSGQNMIQSPACNPFHNISGTAHSGNFMCGLSGGAFSTYDPVTGLYGPTESHTYARTTLATPLTAGQNYYVQFFYKIQVQQAFLKLGDGLGLYLSAGAPTFTNVWGWPNYFCCQSISPSLTPQFQNPAGNIISNVNWLPMGGIYTPQVAGIDHITVGNFKPAAATNFSPSPSSGGSIYYIDDVSVTQLTLGVRPVPGICTGMTTAITPTTCIPPFCTATYTWLPSTGLSSPNSINTNASPNATTTYTLYQTITNAIGATFTNSTTITVSVTPTSFTWTAGAVSQVVCTNLGQSGTTLTASGSLNAQYEWYPGQLLGPVQPLTISANSVYTVFATFGICAYSKTVSVVVSSVCCTSTVGAVSAANINGVDIYGPAVINMDLTIGGNTISRFRDGEFLIAPGVRITVLPGSQLELKGAHLYACSNTMWQGIDVLNGGRILSTPTLTNTTLIEDAITAINIDNVNSVPSMSLTELNQVIFNKNYVAVSINNATTNAVPNHLIANVFTSRTLTFTATQWPKASTIAPDLRAAINPTTGLAPPYTLQNAPVSNLKNPYSTQPGHIGVRITNVGNTTGYASFGVDVGESQSLAGSTAIFNLFDALGFGIYAENANVNSINNVYQNMQRYNTINGQVGGDGIYHAATWLMNTRLDLSDPYGTIGSYAGNRFWDCYKAVNGYNTFQFLATYGIYRSTQSYTTTGGIYFPGNTGIYLNSSRFNYQIQNNNFNNLRNAINIPIFAGLNNVVSLQNGIYAGIILITDNYFGAQTSSSLAIGTQYMSQGINVSCPNNTGWQDANMGMGIASNNFNRVYRGISINGFNGYTSAIYTNSISLINDLLAGGNQRGIQIANTLNKVNVLTNTVSATAQTNTLITLVYSSLNAGSGSPSITCNYLNTAHKGFEFNSNNPGTVWMGNIMNNLSKGMVLSSNGIIGVQGGTGNPSDNQWFSFGSGANGTWTESGSNAINSKLWINNLAGTWTPPNNNGINPVISYLQAASIGTTTGSYACAVPGNPPPAFLMSPPPGNEEASEDMLYSSTTNLYRYLDEHPAQMDSSAQLEAFYDSLTIGSMGKFKQVEEKFFDGQTAQALSINSAIIPENNVEWNYKTYYQLYDRYTNHNFSSADSSSLYDLASLCPGNEGPCVYQARALYNMIYQTVLQVTENCDDPEEQGERRFATNLPKKLSKPWVMELFPNPGNGELTLRNPAENELLQLSIKDLSGRLLLNRQISVRNYTADIRLHLQDGVYLVTLKNSKNETSIKKLVIAN